METLGSYGHPYEVLQYTLVPFHAPLQCCLRAPDYVSVVRGSTDDFYCCFYKNVENRTHTLHFVHFVKCSSVLGGFFLACEDFGRMFDNPFTACALKKKSSSVYYQGNCVTSTQQGTQTLYSTIVLRMRLQRSPHVCAHAKRWHTHVKDPVVHVIVRWIMETQAYPAYTIATK